MKFQGWVKHGSTLSVVRLGGQFALKRRMVLRGHSAGRLLPSPPSELAALQVGSWLAPLIALCPDGHPKWSVTKRVPLPLPVCLTDRLCWLSRCGLLCLLVSLRWGFWTFYSRHWWNGSYFWKKGVYDISIYFLVRYWATPDGRPGRRKVWHASFSQDNQIRWQHALDSYEWSIIFKRMHSLYCFMQILS